MQVEVTGSNPWRDVEAPRGPKATDAGGMTLRVDKAGRDGALSIEAARWLQAHLPGPADGVRVRIQHNVNTGEVALVPSIDPDAVAVRVPSKAKEPLPRRFYVIRLARLGLVKSQQLVRLRPVSDEHGDRLMLVGVKRPTR